MNLCRACGCDFGSVRAFETHRVGVHEYTFAVGMAMTPPREDGRRCLDTDEMEAKGFLGNSYGRWTLAEGLKRGRAIRVGARAS